MTDTPPPAAAIGRVAAAGEVLAAALEAENRALAARDWPAVAGGAGAKRDAAAAYERALADLDRADRLPAEAKRRLAALGARIESAARANERRLALLIIAQRRVIEAIAAAVEHLTFAGYAATGGRASGGGRAVLSVDRAC